MKYPKEFYTPAKKRAGSKKTKKIETAGAAMTAQGIAANPPGEPSYCGRVARGVDNYLERKREEKANAISPVKEAGACPCSGDGTSGSTASGGVDLIVLMDSSSSMYSPANSISGIASKAVEESIARCNAKANVTYLFVDRNDSGADSSTTTMGGVFDTSHERYLIDTLGLSGPFASDNDGGYPGEQGAHAIVDLSPNFNWTPGYCRTILYISDERLSTYGGDDPASRVAADLAIVAANANNVAIHTHFVGNDNGPAATGATSVPIGNPSRAIIATHYQDMADETGGFAQIDTAVTVITSDLYIDLISKAICEGCGNSEPTCSTADLPELEPCVSVSWGDSECDCMEGDDHEEICISICNCYDNVTFRNVKIAAIVITDEDGRRPPRLPDGSPSSELYPVGPYCFGDIAPCKDGEKSCVTRNAMIINRGLPPGTWKVRIVGLCFDVTHHYDERVQEYEFTVCKN